MCAILWIILLHNSHEERDRFCVVAFKIDIGLRTHVAFLERKASFDSCYWPSSPHHGHILLSYQQNSNTLASSSAGRGLISQRSAIYFQRRNSSPASFRIPTTKQKQ